MIINGKEVKLGISFTHYQPDDVQKFIDAGFECFEIGLRARMPDPNPLAKSPAERRKNPYTFDEAHALACRGEEEKLVACTAHLAEAVLAAGKKVWSVHLPFGGGWDAAHINEKDRADAVSGYKRMIDLTSGWHPSVYVLHGCLEPVADSEREARISHCIKSVKEINEYARQRGARVALEDLPRSCIGNTTAEMKRIVDATGVKICFDVNHLLGDSHQNFLDALDTEIITTHLSDYDGIDERHWLPGKGIVPWKLLFERLEAVNYDGPYLFELSAVDGVPYGADVIAEAFRGVLE